MKIIYVADIFFPNNRANSVNVLKMCDALANGDRDVTLLIPGVADSQTKQDIMNSYNLTGRFKIIDMGISKMHRGVLILFALKVLTHLFRMKERDDTILMGRSIYGIFAGRIMGLRVHFDFHGEVWNKNFLRYLIIRHLCSYRSASMSFNTEELMSIFKGRFRHVNDIKLVFAQNGTDLNRLNDNFPLKSKGEYNIGYLGSLSSGRGIELILKIADARPSWSFPIVGGDITQIEKLSEDIRANVIFYGHVTYREGAAFRSCVDALIAPYQMNVTVPSGEMTVEYMSPLKLFEYMASGVPFVTSKIPVLTNFLNEDNCMLVFPVDDYNQWIIKIEELLVNKNLGRRIAAESLRIAKQHYTWDIRVKKILNTIKNL